MKTHGTASALKTLPGAALAAAELQADDLPTAATGPNRNSDRQKHSRSLCGLQRQNSSARSSGGTDHPVLTARVFLVDDSSRKSTHNHLSKKMILVVGRREKERKKFMEERESVGLQ